MQQEHKRACHAYEKVEEYKTFKDYKTWANRLPGMIQSCGLLQTLGFYESKKKGKPEEAASDPVTAILDCLKSWLREEWVFKGILTNDPLLSRSVATLPVPSYVLTTREAMAYAVWLKRYVSSIIPD